MVALAETPDNWKWKYPVFPIKALPVDSGKVPS